MLSRSEAVIWPLALYFCHYAQIMVKNITFHDTNQLFHHTVHLCIIAYRKYSEKSVIQTQAVSHNQFHFYKVKY